MDGQVCVLISEARIVSQPKGKLREVTDDTEGAEVKISTRASVINAYTTMMVGLGRGAYAGAGKDEDEPCCEPRTLTRLTRSNDVYSR